MYKTKSGFECIMEGSELKLLKCHSMYFAPLREILHTNSLLIFYNLLWCCKVSKTGNLVAQSNYAQLFLWVDN